MTVPHFASRHELERHQLETLNGLLAALRTRNRFWEPRLMAAGIEKGVQSLEEFRARMPLLTKAELAADQTAHPPYGTNLTFHEERYVRAHQTSSTSGAPLRWLDTAADWSFMVDRWVEVFLAAGVTAHDRFFCAFSFGPFIGLWLAFEAAQRIGCVSIPGGAMDSRTRLASMVDHRATVLCCTPTYALHLGEVAREQGVAVPSLQRIVVGGEPGASVPAVRERIESLWNGARLFDHHGMTEVGAVTFQAAGEVGVLHVMESGFLAEVVDPATGAPLDPGAGTLGELVLTTLARPGAPVLRYRTGDLVQPDGFDPPPRPYLRLAGGIRARADQMVIVRGVNVYPSAVDDLVRRVPGVAEYRVEVDRSRAMVDLQVVVEPAEGVDARGLAERLARAFRESWNLRVPVRTADRGALPRFELKARRWVEVAAPPPA